MKMLSDGDLIFPGWPAPANVKSLQTTRTGGFSAAPYDSLNLGMHVGDDPLLVARNRQQLNRHVPTEPVWLNQVHGITVVDAALASCVPDADAAFARRSGTVCVTMTADCLPVLLCDRQGSVVAAAHAGWRGLCDGVIEATVEAMHAAPDSLMAWLGPAIGPQAFEIGEEVRQAFIAAHSDAISAFTPSSQGKWLGNLYLLARQRLNRLGVTAVYGGGIDRDFCTFTDQARFFSFRRDGATGRMASMIWLA
jgi:YfiH family protein